MFVSAVFHSAFRADHSLEAFSDRIGKRDLVQSGMLGTTTNRAQTDARWHWEISFSACTTGVE